MRFRDQRAVAEEAVKLNLPKDYKGDRDLTARRVIRHASKPKAEPAATIGKGDNKKPLKYSGGKNRSHRRALGLTAVKPARLRKRMPRHWFRQMMEEKARDRAMLEQLQAEDERVGREADGDS